MTKSKKEQLLMKTRPLRRDRTVVKIQMRHIEERPIFSVSIPSWIVKELSLNHGDTMIVDLIDKKIVLVRLEASN